MGDKQPTFDFSKLNFNLSGQGGFAFDPSALSDIQSKLGSLVGTDSGYFDTLPKTVQRRVRALRNLDVSSSHLVAIDTHQNLRFT